MKIDLPETSIATPFRNIFQKQENFYFRMAEVQWVVPEEKRRRKRKLFEADQQEAEKEKSEGNA